MYALSSVTYYVSPKKIIKQKFYLHQVPSSKPNAQRPEFLVLSLSFYVSTFLHWFNSSGNRRVKLLCVGALEIEIENNKNFYNFQNLKFPHGKTGLSLSGVLYDKYLVAQ